MPLVYDLKLPDGEDTYKVRAANTDTNVGKSNGYRIIYYVVKNDKEIYLLQEQFNALQKGLDAQSDALTRQEIDFLKSIYRKVVPPERMGDYFVQKSIDGKFQTFLNPSKKDVEPPFLTRYKPGKGPKTPDPIKP